MENHVALPEQGQAAPRSSTASRALWERCRQFVEDQSSGEWTDALIRSDADKLMAFVVAERAEMLEALQLILPLAKGYAPEGQTPQAKRTCRSWIESAEAAIAKAEGKS